MLSVSRARICQTREPIGPRIPRMLKDYCESFPSDTRARGNSGVLRCDSGSPFPDYYLRGQVSRGRQIIQRDFAEPFIRKALA